MSSTRNFFIYLTTIIQCVDPYQLKSYNLNKHSQDVFDFDCLHTTRETIPVPHAFTVCYRQKPISTHAPTWSKIFLGSLNDDRSKIENGLEFSIWSSGPWIGLRSNISTVWVGLGEESFDLLAWRHTCLSIDFVDGYSALAENGKLQVEGNYEEIVLFKRTLSFNMNIISVGCAFTVYKESDVGIITDFQMFGRTLSHQEMKDWTGCSRRIYGDIINWIEIARH